MIDGGTSFVPIHLTENAFEVWWDEYFAYQNVKSVQTEINLHM